ncbi:TetR/AcrR family transcriptional regulator [Streptomyces sp. NPDC127190]|uniref:TetR/AcrR family transcriptional regulator n=1 Tax=unclassified Streptomyces TaxID=2593676 RepID=UPI00363D5EB2
MATPVATHPRAQAGPAEERRAVVEAARAVFARDGWLHTSLEDVATAAGLDADAVAHYFKDKEQLLLSVLLDSAASLSAALTVVAESHLAEITDLEQDLVALGLDWLSPLATYPEHFAIVRHLQAEAARVPAGVLEMWQTAGPRQAQRELARRLERVAERGLLDIPDADHAAGRFVQLVAGGVVGRSFHGALPLAEYETEQLVRAGVADFIHLFRPGADR